MSAERYSFVVHGRVQGVSFRAFTRGAAQDRGVTGYVANHADGTVRGECQGSTAAVRGFVEDLRRGSPWSRVERVETHELAPLETAERGFEIRR